MKKLVLILGWMIGIPSFVRAQSHPIRKHHSYDIVGNKHVRRQHQALDGHGIDGIVFSGYGHLIIEPGATASISVEAESNVLPYVEYYVSNGQLHIGLQYTHPGQLGKLQYVRVLKEGEQVLQCGPALKCGPIRRYTPLRRYILHRPIIIRLRIPHISQLTTYGATHLVAQPGSIGGKKIRVFSAGKSSVMLKHLTTRYVSVKSSGVASVNLYGGHVQRLVLQAGGCGRLITSCKSTTAEATLGGKVAWEHSGGIDHLHARLGGKTSFTVKKGWIYNGRLHIGGKAELRRINGGFQEAVLYAGGRSTANLYVRRKLVIHCDENARIFYRGNPILRITKPHRFNKGFIKKIR